ncbi:AraC family transcriptional regulator [Cellvibrio polysaccharolyticus]|nr:helix-turn-helix transcriptional regulator [Cellvibrio polysaccharolyticus]
MAIRENESEAWQHLPRPVVAWAGAYAMGDSVPMHQHPRAQLLYAVEGVMRIHTSDRVWIIPPQRALWVPPGVLHSHISMSDVQMRTLYINPDIAEALGLDCYVFAVSPLLRELILALSREPMEYPVPGRGEHLVALILSEIASASRVHMDIPWPSDRRLQQVCQRVLDNPGAANTIEQLADAAGASSRTMIRLFQKQTGLRYRQWLQQVQLAEALARLDRGESIATIARALGYARPGAFSAMFRKHFGSSPQHYWKQQ